MVEKNIAIGLLALIALLSGIVSGIALAPLVSGTIHEKAWPIRGLEGGILHVGIRCGRIVYVNESISLDSLEELRIIVRSGKAYVSPGEPRLIVYALKGFLCNPTQRRPRWSLSIQNRSLTLDLREGIAELHVLPEKLRILQAEVESGSLQIGLSGLGSLEESGVRVASGLASVSLEGLSRLSSFEAIAESGVGSVELGFRENSDGRLDVSVHSGELGVELKGNVTACLESSRIVSGMAKIGLPEKCSQNAFRVNLDLDSGVASIRLAGKDIGGSG